jgi:hypothetical protein
VGARRWGPAGGGPPVGARRWAPAGGRPPLPRRGIEARARGILDTSPRPVLPVPADYARLRDVLTRELAAGGRDETVEGGLDGLLRAQARDEHPASALLRMIAALPPDGYAALEGEERETWLRRALATVRRELALEESLEPVRPDAPGGRPRSGRATAAKAKKPKSPPPTPPPATEAPAATPSRPSKSGAKPVTRSVTPRSAANKIAEGAAGLDAPVEKAGTGLRGQALARLERLGIRTVRDALQHYPFRHIDFSRPIPISAVRAGDEATVRGVVERSRLLPMGRGGRMNSAEVTISDGMGRISAIFFNQAFQTKNFPVGTHGRLVPVYHLTEGLAPAHAPRRHRQAARALRDRLEDPLPEAIRARHACWGWSRRRARCTTRTTEASLREARGGWRSTRCWRSRSACRRASASGRQTATRRSSATTPRPTPSSRRCRSTSRRRSSACSHEIRGDLARTVADVAAARGRRGVREDGGRARGDALARRGGLPGGADGADRGAGGAALPHDLPVLSGEAEPPLTASCGCRAC